MKEKKHDKAVRDRTVEEFRDRLEKHEQENWIEHQEYGITWADIDCVCEQMKEGGENGKNKQFGD